MVVESRPSRINQELLARREAFASRIRPLAEELPPEFAFVHGFLSDFSPRQRSAIWDAIIKHGAIEVTGRLPDELATMRQDGRGNMTRHDPVLYQTENNLKRAGVKGQEVYLTGMISRIGKLMATHYGC